jgi:hypothetical protein
MREQNRKNRINLSDYDAYHYFFLLVNLGDVSAATTTTTGDSNKVDSYHSTLPISGSSVTKSYFAR